jgi:hypothetical protein
MIASVTPTTIWIEEPAKAVWHRATRRLRALEYEVACGWDVHLREGRVWPQKSWEPGPRGEERCHSCVGN